MLLPEELSGWEGVRGTSGSMMDCQSGSFADWRSSTGTSFLKSFSAFHRQSNALAKLVLSVVLRQARPHPRHPPNESPKTTCRSAQGR